jgi:hypothetical protein
MNLGRFRVTRRFALLRWSLPCQSEFQQDRLGRLTFWTNDFLIGFWFGDECRNVCDTLRCRRPLSECPAALRTHEQNRRIAKRNVGPGVALLANYLTVCSEVHKVLLERHTGARSLAPPREIARDFKAPSGGTARSDWRV